jgi:hypothetical protein
MKTFLIILTTVILSSNALAQGGIGNKPRTDLVMLSAVVRDSLSDLAFEEIMNLKRYAESNNIDSAAMLMAYKDTSKVWTRAINLADSAERQYVVATLAKIGKLFHDFSDTRKQYYTVYKTKETPSGQKHTYVIVHSSGKKQRTVSWIFYPIGDKLLLGEF